MLKHLSNTESSPHACSVIDYYIEELGKQYFYVFRLMPHIKAFNMLGDDWLLGHYFTQCIWRCFPVRHSLTVYAL